MSRAVAALLALLALGCARHYVIERQGRVDGKRSIASTSDTEWTIRSEPQPAAPPASASEPEDRPAEGEDGR